MSDRIKTMPAKHDLTVASISCCLGHVSKTGMLNPYRAVFIQCFLHSAWLSAQLARVVVGTSWLGLARMAYRE